MPARKTSTSHNAPPPEEPTYREYTPSDALRPFVDCFWTREVGSRPVSNATPSVHRVLPDGCIDVVLTFADRGDVPQAALVVGTMTKALVIEPTATPECFVGVRFRPAKASAFLEMPASEVTDLRVSLDDIWPDANAVRDALAAGPDTIARVRALERVLTARLTLNGPRATADVDEAVRRIVDAGGSLGITRLAPALGLTRQHLARRFSELVGVSPKTFARVVRLGRVVERVRGVPAETPISWSTLAIELGYYDQSHLVDEFREMTGTTPTVWRAAGG
ncbi:MAG TPA: AraC family transcriptional regulator [Gemmatimonadaceae bacterium]|nr:AraC family transcriptional regulator [Gemmatimonadaceae bacterium]